jgi:hypothetical protein
MLYDLNKLHDDHSKARTIKVPDGANYKEITLHKVIIGGTQRTKRTLKSTRALSW